MIPHNLPDYVERGGQQVYRPPARARQVELYGLVAKADRSAIDALLQRDLVLPSRGAVDYRCAHDHVIVTFGSIGRESSADPVDSQKGYVSEREVSVWCLVADVAAKGRLLWYLPYIFTDSGQTVATGREIFGYPKQIGYFEDGYPDRLGAAGGVTTVQALAVHPFGPDQQAIRRAMISVARKPGAAAVPSRPAIADELDLFFPGGLGVNENLPHGPGPSPSATITPADAPPPPGAPPVAPWIRGVLNALQGRALTGNSRDLIVDMVNNTTLVFLKQFRDIGCPTKACYQAVTEAPISIDPLGASYQALDPSSFELTVHSWDSAPIAAELGMATAPAIVPHRAFHATLGFDIQLGLEVWRAPT
jgi:hypothetical protein